MTIAERVRRCAVIVGLIGFAACARVCRADCESTVYAYNDRVVVFSCGQAGPELRVVQLDDTGPLKFAGSVAVPSSREFDTAGHYKDFVMLVRWDKFEVYDLADPIHPRLAAKFDLHKQANLAGFSRIEQTAENKFLVISSMGAEELATEGQPTNWTLKEVPATDDVKKKVNQRPPEYRFMDENEPVVEVRKNNKFRYELYWKNRTKPGEILHQQYLRKVDVATGKNASVLLLGEHLETID